MEVDLVEVDLVEVDLVEVDLVGVRTPTICMCEIFAIT